MYGSQCEVRRWYWFGFGWFVCVVPRLSKVSCSLIDDHHTRSCPDLSEGDRFPKRLDRDKSNDV